MLVLVGKEKRSKIHLLAADNHHVLCNNVWPYASETWEIVEMDKVPYWRECWNCSNRAKILNNEIPEPARPKSRQEKAKEKLQKWVQATERK